MSFFNSKEEVLDIELTPYGKLLLSRGVLKPTYYSFHDDDVLYDVEYAGLTENTNFAEVRIQDETPVHKPFYSFSSPKMFLDRDLNQEKFLSNKADLTIQKTSLPPNILSNSTISNLYIPSWEIYNLSSNFSSSATTFTNNNVINASIPQFDVEMNTYFFKTNQEQIDEDPKLQQLSFEGLTYKDDDIYITLNNPLLLKIIENNVDFENDAFDLEIYKVSKDENNNETYTQLKFNDTIQNYDNESNLYVNINNNLESTNVIDETYADYYFDVLLDKDISTINICKFVLKSTENQDIIFNDISVCDDIRNQFITENLYDLTDLATGKNC